MENTINSSVEWCLVRGSNWESNLNAEADAQSHRSLVDIEQLVGPAFRQMKYELYCATRDLLGFSIELNTDRNCSIRLCNPNGDVESTMPMFEFIYDYKDKRYTDAVWTEHMQKYADVYQYWVLERQCIPGFLAEIFLRTYDRSGEQADELQQN